MRKSCCYKSTRVSYFTLQKSLQKIADCKVCLLSNAKQRSHNHHSERKASRRHERLHCDTLGPFRSENNKWYLTSVIDEHTGYIEGIITKDRKVKDLLIQRLKIWNNRFNDKVAYFRSDNAPEFPQPSDLAEFGIWRETIAAYLPELNGLAEVVNKLILQQIYRIVVTLGPQILKLIYYVIQYSITMINHTPRRSLKGQTPYGCYYQLSEEISTGFLLPSIVSLHLVMPSKRTVTELHQLKELLHRSWVL